MRFKHSKETIIEEAQFAAERAFLQVKAEFENKLQYGGYLSSNEYLRHRELSVADNLELMSITAAIKAAVAEIVESIYTDEDFEKDIGLTE